MPEDTKATVASWNLRAKPYLELARRYSFFDLLTSRLLDSLPSDFRGAAVDIGGGFGLSTAALLDRFPEARVCMFEPAAAMRDLARTELARFGKRMEIREDHAHQLPARGFDAAISSAVMHLLDEAEILPVVGRALAPGGRFAFNLWGHSWSPLEKDPEASAIWEPALDAALAELKLGARPPKREDAPRPPSPRLRDRAGMTAAALEGGLELVSVTVDVDELPASFFLDFAAMSGKFLPRLRGPMRGKVMARARELASAPVKVQSVRLLLQRHG